MLRTAEITVALSLTGAPFHGLYWRPDVHFALDCFICRRTGRTTELRTGAASARCSGSRSGLGPHPAPARISAFDTTSGTGTLSLRMMIDSWWAPFQDEPPVPRASWVRLHLGYRCPGPGESGEFSTQSNLHRPSALTCKFCDEKLAVSEQAPAIRHLP